LACDEGPSEPHDGEAFDLRHAQRGAAEEAGSVRADRRPRTEVGAYRASFTLTGLPKPGNAPRFLPAQRANTRPGCIQGRFESTLMRFFGPRVQPCADEQGPSHRTRIGTTIGTVG
jgi:hypothetical protein